MFDRLKGLSQNGKTKVKWTLIGFVLGVSMVVGLPIVRTVVGWGFVFMFVFALGWLALRIDWDDHLSAWLDRHGLERTGNEDTVTFLKRLSMGLWEELLVDPIPYNGTRTRAEGDREE